MDRFRELETFLAVAEAGAFNGAARRLRLSPPAVTRAIRRSPYWVLPMAVSGIATDSRISITNSVLISDIGTLSIILRCRARAATKGYSTARRKSKSTPPSACITWSM